MALVEVSGRIRASTASHIRKPVTVALIEWLPAVTFVKRTVPCASVTPVHFPTRTVAPGMSSPSSSVTATTKEPVADMHATV